MDSCNLKGNKKTVHDGRGKEIAGVCDSEGVLLYKKWRGTGGQGTRRKGAGRCTGGWRRGGKREGELTQHCAIFRNRKNARGASQQIQSGIKEYGKWGV